MDSQDTLINGQPVPREIKELASSEDGVNTAIVAFLHPDFKRTSDADTLIRKPLEVPMDGVPTVIED